jgi:hypothetical protein
MDNGENSFMTRLKKKYGSPGIGISEGAKFVTDKTLDASQVDDQRRKKSRYVGIVEKLRQGN